MPLINCSECNNEISDQANACPHCGFTKPKPRKFGCGTILVIALVIIPIYSVLNSINSYRPHPSAPNVKTAAQPKKLTDADLQLQAKRKAFIDAKIKDGLFYKIEIPGNLPHLWVSHRFNNLEFDDKNYYLNMVYAYYITEKPAYDLIVIFDSKSGKEIGNYSELGLRMK